MKTILIAFATLFVSMSGVADYHHPVVAGQTLQRVVGTGATYQAAYDDAIARLPSGALPVSTSSKIVNGVYYVFISYR